VGRGSDLLRALTVQESNPVFGRDFPEQYKLVLQQPSEYRVIPGGVQRVGRGFDHPPQSSAEVKENVELYRYSPSGHTSSVLGRALPLPHINILQMQNFISSDCSVEQRDRQTDRQTAKAIFLERGMKFLLRL
jgi:hypothetical protein